MLIRVLLLSSDSKTRAVVRRALKDLEVLLTEETLKERLWARLGQESFDLVIADEGSLASRSVSEIRSLPDRPETIFLSTGSNETQRADLLASGAFAVVSPELDGELLRDSLKTIVDRFREIGVDRIRAEERPRSVLEDFSSTSPKMAQLLSLARKVVAVDSSLLILGETGVGKEWLARAIHTEGPRSQAPFFAINCAAVPETLLESELFGHEKGAFTGAVRSRRGAFELAHQGTLFLDEIGDLPVHLQVKLLRVLQDHQIQRIGSERSMQVDVRIMTATNCDLQNAMESGSFRRDLYYRLSVVSLTVPPLRDRRADIAPLVENYLAQFKLQFARDRIEGIDEAAAEALTSYDWPGNVRELINVLERAVLLCDDDIVSLVDLPEEIAGAGHGQELAEDWDGGFEVDRWIEDTLDEGRRRIVESFETAYLERLLEETKGHVGETARRAGIESRTLYNKMKSYGLRKEDYRAHRASRRPVPRAER